MPTTKNSETCSGSRPPFSAEPTTDGRIRLVVADDHFIVRLGVRKLLERHDDILVVGEASDGEGALLEVRRLQPDVLLLDLKMPGLSGIDTMTLLKAQSPTLPVLVFSSFAEESQVCDVIRAGALGYIMKDVVRDELVRAIRTVSAGQAWLHPIAQRKLLDRMSRPPSPIDQLSGRERDVLTLLGQGLNNQHIATRLFLSEGTVKAYVGRLLDKLCVADRTQAALLAHNAGLKSVDARQTGIGRAVAAVAAR